MSTKIKELKMLTELPKDEYIAMLKDLNPDLTEEDLKDMFPQGWEANHKNINYDYDSFAKHQMIIDAQLEEQFGGYESYNDINDESLFDHE